jgi:hypothetical protein
VGDRIADNLVDERGELALLGAALTDQGIAARVVEVLEPRDFTDKGRRAVYSAMAERFVRGAEGISPAAVFEEIGASRANGLTVDELTTWSLDSSAAGDEAAADTLIYRLQRLRRHRDLKRRLRELILANPDDVDQLERMTKSLERIEGDLAALGNNGHGPEVKRVDLAGALRDDEDEPIPWALRGWLCRGDVAMLAGDAGIGKSWLLLDLALCMAAGESWLGTVPLEGQAQRVLYVDEENNDRLVRYRVRKWAIARGVIPIQLDALPISYLAGNAFTLDDDRCYAQLREEVDRFRPDWIMFDSLVRFHGRRENDNAQMSEWFNRKLKPLCARTGAGAILLHHLRKHYKDADNTVAGRLRGASDFRAWLDQLWAIEEDPDAGVKRLVHDKNRWTGTQPPLKIEIEDVKGGKGTAVLSRGRADDSEGAVVTALDEAQEKGMLRSRLVEVVKGEGLKEPGRATSRILGKLYDDGVIRKRKEGRATRYWMRHYAPIDAEILPGLEV